MAPNLAAQLRLVAVTDGQLLAGRDVVEACLAAERGGATMIQLRLKEAPPGELAALARALLARLTVPLVINDRADVAIAVGAAGVHLGPDDVPAALIRRIAPPGFLIGVSVGLTQEIPNGQAADYWGIGPFRVTSTKVDAGAALGVEGVRDLVLQAAGRPCVAIGGVRPEDVAPLQTAGVAGVAVVSGVFSGEAEEGARAYAP
ncbi:MAG: thiamine phosphate synthase [Gemmatimonadales bacterium]